MLGYSEDYCTGTLPLVPEGSTNYILSAGRALRSQTILWDEVLSPLPIPSLGLSGYNFYQRAEWTYPLILEFHMNLMHGKWIFFFLKWIKISSHLNSQTDDISEFHLERQKNRRSVFFKTLFDSWCFSPIQVIEILLTQSISNFWLCS